MSELNFEEPFETTDVEIPSTLPVLPLKETVVFPESVSPLAIGQERSIQLVDDVARGRAHAGARHRQESRGRAARLGRPLRDRHRRRRSQDDPCPRRDAADPRPGRGPHQARAPRPGRPVPGRRVHGRARRGRGDARARGAHPQRPERVRPPDLARPVPARRARARGGQRGRPERALASRRLDPAAEDRARSRRCSSRATSRCGCATCSASSSASSRSSSSARRSSRRSSRRSRRASASTSCASS